MATELESLLSRSEQLDTSLRNSPTAYLPNTPLTTNDKSLAAQRAALTKQISTLKKKQTRNRWYGATDTSPTESLGSSDGWFSSGIKALQRPMNAIAGAGQYALGKGTESGLVANMNQAMKTGLGWGNILQQSGAPRAVQIPLGFMLDVALDPVNWATMGTAALVPRVGAGLLKGGFKTAARKGAEAGLKTTAREAVEAGVETAIKGWTPLKTQLGADLSAAKGFLGENVGKIASSVGEGWSPRAALDAGLTGLTSGIENKAYKVMKAVPFAKKSATYRDLLTKLGEKAIVGAEKYDTLMGKSVYDDLGKGIFGQPAGIVGDTVENLVRKVPGIKIGSKTLASGDEIADFFKYSPNAFAKVTAEYQKVLDLASDKGLTMGFTDKGIWFARIDDALAPGATVSLEKLTKVSREVADSVVTQAAGKMMKDAYGNEVALVSDVIKAGGQIHISANLDNALSLLQDSGLEFSMKNVTRAFMEIPGIGKTGVPWYDDAVTKVKDTNYNDIINFFRKKVGATPIPREIEKVAQEEVEKTVLAWNSWNAAKESATQLASKAAVFAKGIRPGELKPFNLLLKTLEEVINLFKPFKVAMNPGSFPPAIIGNYFMGLMEGIPVYRNDYQKMMKQTVSLLSGKLSFEDIEKVFMSNVNSLAGWGITNPAKFKETFGFHPNDILKQMRAGEVVRKSFPANGMGDLLQKSLSNEFSRLGNLQTTLENMGKTDEEIFAVLSRLMKTESQLEGGLSEAERLITKKARGAFMTPEETNRAARLLGPITVADSVGTQTTFDLVNSYILENWKQTLRANLEADPTSLTNILLHKFFIGMPKMYEHIDEAFKITTVRYLSQVGVNAQQLKRITQFVPSITKADIIEVRSLGEKLYRISPQKASEVAMDAFMNYSAMPDFVKIMRSLPVLGSSFYSFQYAMAIKSAKTLINNPAIFNKVGFFMNELNAGRTPEEKAAMEEKYNEYLNSSTVVKMFGAMNGDVKNVVPYLSMNMFNPSEKTYDDSPQSQFLKLLDKAPAFQNPVGQIIKDYWIQPLVLSGTGQTPQGQFGQPIMPYYDENGQQITPSLGSQAFYQTRTFLESLVPGSASYLGIPLSWAGVSPEAAEFIPSYGIRSFITAGEKENSMQETLLNIYRRTGLPIYRLDTTKTSFKP